MNRKAILYNVCAYATAHSTTLTKADYDTIITFMILVNDNEDVETVRAYYDAHYNVLGEFTNELID